MQFLYHRGELLQETEGDSPTSYTLGAGIEGFQRDQKTYYYHQDEQLSTALLTNHLGEVQNHYQYDAFGDTLEKVEEIPNRIQYTNQQYDTVTGQYYLRARYYNPILEHFLQEDVYQGDGQNLYAYCGNNPVMYYDPSGYKKVKTTCPEVPVNGDGGEGDVKWTNHGYKHTPEKNKSWKDIINSTNSGPAKYHPDIVDIEDFERDAWKTGKPTTNGKNWKTKEYDSIIGASEGKETTYVRIENSADTIHGHPITKQEYDKLNKEK